MKFQKPTGTQDLLPETLPDWEWVENTFREVCRRSGFAEIRTPMFEHTGLFSRAAGASADVVVTKQMYSFEALDGENYTLRPEGTASIVRAFLENHLGERGPVCKLFYIFPVFRFEAKQAHRYRQHHQCGVEMLGASGPDCDAEILALSHQFLRALGVEATLHLNSLGTFESRRAYIQKLRQHLEPQREKLSDDSKRRLEINPLRVFDSKDERDILALQGAPHLLDHLRAYDRESSAHFDAVCAILHSLKIPFIVDHNLVRGFDYYSRTAFEWVCDALESKTVLGGGRYDGLVEELGGAPTPGIGFGAGIERLLAARQASGSAQIEVAPLTAFVVTLGHSAQEMAPQIVAQIREQGVSCDRDFVGRSMRQQMRESNRKNARFTLIIGDDELASGTVALKNMASSEQTTLPLLDAIRIMKNALHQER